MQEHTVVLMSVEIILMYLVFNFGKYKGKKESAVDLAAFTQASSSAVKELVASHTKVHDAYEKLFEAKEATFKMLKKEKKQLQSDFEELQNILDDREDYDDDGPLELSQKVAVGASGDCVVQDVKTTKSLATVTMELYDKIKNTKEFIEKDLSTRISESDVAMLLNSLAIDEKKEKKS